MDTIQRMFAEDAEYNASMAWQAMLTGSADCTTFFVNNAKHDAAYAVHAHHEHTAYGVHI